MAGSEVAPSAGVGTAARWRQRGRGARPHRDALLGMGLVEVVVAVGLLVTLAAGVVHLFAMSARSTVRARHRTSSLMLAVDKIEQLRAGVQTQGIAVGPLETRGEQTEYLDTNGRLVGRGGTPPSGSMYARVWSVGALPGLNDVLVVRVRVAPIRSGDGVGGRDPAVAPDGARLVTVLPAPAAP